MRISIMRNKISHMNIKDLSSKTKPSTITLPERIDQESKALAEKLGVSRSSLIASLLDIACGNEPKTSEAQAVSAHLASAVKTHITITKNILDELAKVYTPVLAPMVAQNLSRHYLSPNQDEILVAVLEAIANGWSEPRTAIVRGYAMPKGKRPNLTDLALAVIQAQRQEQMEDAFGDDDGTADPLDGLTDAEVEDAMRNGEEMVAKDEAMGKSSSRGSGSETRPCGRCPCSPGSLASWPSAR